jgi:hypothetical protein
MPTPAQVLRRVRWRRRVAAARARQLAEREQAAARSAAIARLLDQAGRLPDP